MSTHYENKGDLIRHNMLASMEIFYTIIAQGATKLQEVKG